MPPSIATPLSSGTTGHAEDPTGLTWGRARCYAPRTGGWTGEDPVFTEPRYAYVGGRPSYGVDPTGRTEALEQTIFSIKVSCKTARFFNAFSASLTVAMGILGAVIVRAGSEFGAMGPGAVAVLSVALSKEATVALKACG